MHFYSIFMGALMPLVLYGNHLNYWLAGYDFLFWYALPLFYLVLGLIYGASVLTFFAVLTGVFSLFVLLPCVLYFWKTGLIFGTYAAQSILQTDMWEAAEYLFNFFSWREMFCGAALFSLQAFILSKLYRWVLESRKSQIEGLIPLACALLIFQTGILTQTFLGNAFTAAFVDRAFFGSLTDDAVQRQAKLGEKSIFGGGVDVALVLGESYTASHCGSAQYRRNTTPWLDSMVQKGQAVYFTNAYACGTSSASVLPLLLTEKNQYNDMQRKKALTLVEAAKKSGYKVVWISMQTKEGVQGFIANQADEVFWLRSDEKSTDFSAVEKLRDLSVRWEPTLYVIQLLGSQTAYDKRYPEGFGQWKTGSAADNYDNSVLFNDKVMENLYKELFGRLDVSAMLYVSDHGEEVQRFFRHGEDLFEKYVGVYPEMMDMLHIPMYVFYSKLYGEKNNERVQNLRSNRDAYFSNDMIYDTMLGLMRIGGTRYHREFDITTSGYVGGKNNLRVAGGRKLSTLVQ